MYVCIYIYINISVVNVIYYTSAFGFDRYLRLPYIYIYTVHTIKLFDAIYI